jgi:PPOX class probable F420-dependent enzyme
VADHAVLCTVNVTGGIDAVPVCQAVLGDVLAVPIETVKPKRSTALRRVENLDRDPRATLLCEHWDADDWSRLWWVRASLIRIPVDEPELADLARLLREKYRQYREASFVALLTFRVDAVAGWSG